MTGATTTPPSRAGRREWLGLAVLTLPCLLYSMDFTVLHLAVPHLSAALQPTSAQLLWIVDIYGFLLAGSLLSMGVLGDRIGRRKLLLIGAAAFGLASLFAAFATSAESLILARALLGLAAATMAPSTLSLIRNMFADPRQRSAAIGVWVASFSAGAAIGPLVGGALLASLWWGSVFLIAVPPMLLLLVVAPFLLPEYRTPRAERLDLTSAGLSLIAILAAIFGVKELAANGFGTRALASLGGGVLSAVMFVRRQHRQNQPFIDLTLFRQRTFSIMLSINTLDFFLGFGAFLFVTQYQQAVLGLGPLEAGVWTLPWAIVQVAGSLLTPLLVRRMRPGHLVAASMALTAVGLSLLSQVSGRADLWLVVLGSVIFSFALIQVTTIATDILLGSVPPERAGMASGLSETSSELGGALGIALLGSIATVVYQGALAQTLPAGLAAPAAEAARETVGGALSVANELPAAMHAALIAAARAAFTDAASVAFGLGAVIALATAVVAALTLARE